MTIRREPATWQRGEFLPGRQPGDRTLRRTRPQRQLSPDGQFISMLTMFLGRLGPLTFILALAAKEARARHQWPQAAVRIG